jgi:nucleotide-binding universal stress UspA family protein
MNILLAVDDSLHSQTAVEAALSRTWPAKSNFNVVCVIESLDGEERANRLVAEAEESARHLVEKIADKIKKKFDDTSVQYEVLHGNSSKMLIDTADKWQADLIVMGSRGRQGLTRLLLGSVSQKVLLEGKCSVLIVRNNPTTDFDTSWKRILLALDEKDCSRACLDWALSLPNTGDISFKVVNVLDLLVDKYSDGLSALYSTGLSQERLNAKATAKEFLQGCVDKLEKRFGANSASYAVMDGEPGQQILSAAESWPAGSIMMGSRNLSGTSRLLLGSVSQAVVLKAACPVEVVKAR